MSERRVALFDIDRTLYNGFILFDLAQIQKQEGIISSKCYQYLNEIAEEHQSGQLPYETFARNLLTCWAQGLEGISYTTTLNQVRRLLSRRDCFYPHTFSLIEQLRPTHDIYFVTGEPQFVGETVRDFFQATGFIASKFNLSDNLFNGRVESYLAGRGEKQALILPLFERYPREGSFAFGDSEADIEMLSLVEFPICINPNDGLREYALEKGWDITEPQTVEKIVYDLLKQC